MVEDVRRLHHILVGHMDAVAMQGSDLQAVVGQLVACVVLRNLQDASDRQSGAVAQLLHRGPSMGVQRDVEVGRAVAEYQAHASAVPDAESIIFVQSYLLIYREVFRSMSLLAALERGLHSSSICGTIGSVTIF